MKRRASTILLAAFAVLVSGAATVPVGTYVCNPGALVRVPVSLDHARGLSGIAVTLAYDPQVVVCSRVEPGSLSGVFGDDFLVADDGSGTVSASLFRLGGDLTEDAAGTIATFVFLVRQGTAGQFSDVTVTKVELLEESGVRDATLSNPVSTKNGMIRVMAADAAAARLEEAQTVVADARLGSVALSDGDAIQASDAGTPILVSGGVSSGAPIPVTAPDRGWATAVYTLLKTETAGLTFVSATNGADRLDVMEERENGVSTYTLVVGAVDGIEVLSLDDDLDAALQAYVRECANGLDGIDTVWVSGGSNAVSIARAFGIRPRFFASGNNAEAEFAMPSVRCTAIDVARGTVSAVVEPAPGNTIAGNGNIRGIVELLGTPDLSTLPSKVEGATIDFSPYFVPESKGEFKAAASFGDNRFFRILLKDKNE